MAKIIDAETHHQIIEVVKYLDNNLTTLNFNRANNKPKSPTEIFNNLFLLWEYKYFS